MLYGKGCGAHVLGGTDSDEMINEQDTHGGVPGLCLDTGL
jgi:hypothetical protein